MTRNDGQSRPFDRRFPSLASVLPRVVLGDFPTPLLAARELEGAIGTIGELRIKDDSRTSRLYGGNKVRKLEYLLGDAIRRGAKEVLTFGFLGSNHAAATAVHAAAHGMRSISMLLPQADAPYVARNLAASREAGAEIHTYGSVAQLVAGTTYELARHRMVESRWPYVIAAGGSSPLGTVGFVAAGLELAEQLATAGLPPPDRLYVALGSCGTAVGLAIGAELAGLPTRIVAVRVTEPRYANAGKVEALWRKTCAFLHGADPDFPRLAYAPSRLEIRDEHFGEAYAVATPAAAEAIALMSRHESLTLDVAYTGKTLACLIADARGGRLRDSRVVFWNTYAG